MNRRESIFDVAHELGIKVINARSPKDANRIAIHLLNPDLDMLEDAIMQAERDQFPAIVCHSAATFAGGNGQEVSEVQDA